MNVSIIHQKIVKDGVLDELAKEVPQIISRVLEIPGGRMAIVKPEDVSLQFCQASSRDIGSDIKFKVFARSNDPRISTEHQRAREILEKVNAVIAKTGEKYSVDIRIYFMEIGAADYLPDK